MYAQTAEGRVDAMTANEVATHVSLQQKQDCPYLYKLLGGFEVLESDADGGREQASPALHVCSSAFLQHA